MQHPAFEGAKTIGLSLQPAVRQILDRLVHRPLHRQRLHSCSTQFRTENRCALFLELLLCSAQFRTENRNALFLELLIEVEATGPDGK
ncbi:hypothetical protein EOD23_23205 [Mesorhizobium sp. USDA-HM6]|nr:hypothetical protein EOD23_23205 [Mesorhizobium sp. USDA-HM6]